jgi:hypothetical protein
MAGELSAMAAHEPKSTVATGRFRADQCGARTRRRRKPAGLARALRRAIRNNRSDIINTLSD